MKEYVAYTGGRYTYADDLLNLQDLSLSLTSIFAGCADFIISGCEVDGTSISSGYVWLGNKIRQFSGAENVSFPYYIVESNKEETVVYASEKNQCGRQCFLCFGSSEYPTQPDIITGILPHVIEVNREYTPRLLDQFIGKYALLKSTPFSRQICSKDLLLKGQLNVDKGIESKTGFSILNQEGANLKTIIQADGNASIGLYLRGLLVNEVVLCHDGSFRLMKGDKELAQITEKGISYNTSLMKDALIGSIKIIGNQIFNYGDATDSGTIKVNYVGYQGEGNSFRNLEIHDGKLSSVPIVRVTGADRDVATYGTIHIHQSQGGLSLVNSLYTKEDVRLQNYISWNDVKNIHCASLGYLNSDNKSFSIINTLGDIILHPYERVDVMGTLSVKGHNIDDLYVRIGDFNQALSQKVNIVDGKGLSTEDFTSELKLKLESITTGNLEIGGEGYVTSEVIYQALQHKLTTERNLDDLTDFESARRNLSVLSKSESESLFLQIRNGLKELVRLTEDEVNSLSPKEAAQLLQDKQTAIRLTLDAEKAGASLDKLTCKNNLSDVDDIPSARMHLDVYSKKEIDDCLARKMNSEDAYVGETFTTAEKKKLGEIQTGCFPYIDSDGVSHVRVEGYAKISQIEKQFTHYAPRLLDGLNSDEQKQVANNLGTYTKDECNKRFASVESLFQDYIQYLVSQNKTTDEALNQLHERLNIMSKPSIENAFLRKDMKLLDLNLPSEESKRQTCDTIGAAYAKDYQPLLLDSGWLTMENSGSRTDTRQIFIRQIGNIISIQGSINTWKVDGTNQGGVVALIPNKIQPPRYSLRCAATNFNDDHKFNRGASFVIKGGTRKLLIYESGLGNQDVELNFTYFT